MKYLKKYSLFERFSLENQIFENYDRFGTRTITESDFDKIRKENCKNWTKTIKESINQIKLILNDLLLDLSDEGFVVNTEEIEGTHNLFNPGGVSVNICLPNPQTGINKPFQYNLIKNYLQDIIRYMNGEGFKLFSLRGDVNHLDDNFIPNSINTPLFQICNLKMVDDNLSTIGGQLDSGEYLVKNLTLLKIYFSKK
jgi:hypothetical protein